MNSIRILKEAISAMEKGDFEKMESQLHDGFQLTGPTPDPMGKRGSGLLYLPYHLSA